MPKLIRGDLFVDNTFSFGDTLLCGDYSNKTYGQTTNR